jgi:hypothetical protein
MALVLKDRVKETTTTAGTGTITLAGAATGFQSFSVIGNGNTTYYCIAGQGTNEWEVGIGTYTSAGTTLARTTVLASSNAGSLVTFSAGTKDVFVIWPASQAQPFTSAESTASPNATVYVDSLVVNASSTDADVALVAKGTGATLAQVPDSATIGGNKRGNYATDLQKVRGSATYVASGNYSFIGGGQSNTASNSHAVVAGGLSNTASSTYAAVLGGFGNNASGGNASIGGGYQNLVSGVEASCFGGRDNLSDAANSTTFGNQASARAIIGAFSVAPSQVAFSSGGFYAQNTDLNLWATTTDATATVLTSQGGSASTTNQIILPNVSAYYFRGSVVAYVSGSDSKAWTFEGLIRRHTGVANTSLIQSVVNIVGNSSGAASWTIAIAADTTNGGLKVTATGAAATTIRWVCKVETTEVTY